MQIPRRSKGQRGAVIVEMAIAFPLLALLTIGVVDLGRGIWMQSHLTWLSREAARYASVRSNQSYEPASQVLIEDYVRSRARGLEFEKLSVAASWDPRNSRGSNVRVELGYQLNLLVGMMPQAVIQLASSSDRLITY